MSKNLTSLILGASDEVARLKELLELVEISVDQLERSDKLCIRLEILLSSYLAAVSNHFNELETHLENARKLVALPPDPGSNGYSGK